MRFYVNCFKITIIVTLIVISSEKNNVACIQCIMPWNCHLLFLRLILDYCWLMWFLSSLFQFLGLM